MRYEFSGYSDDTFGEILTGDDYDNCASGKPIRYRVYSESQRCGVVVTGQFCPPGSDGWMIGVAPIDPDHDDESCQHAMEWGISFRTCGKNGVQYSPRLVIENAPEDCSLICMERAA